MITAKTKLTTQHRESIRRKHREIRENAYNFYQSNSLPRESIS